MNYLSHFRRVILIILNLFFVVISLALIVGGVILEFFAGKFVGPVLGNFDFVDNNTRSALNIPDLTEVGGLPLLDDVGVFFIVVGCILLVVSFCACCGTYFGACGKWRYLMIGFIVLMSIMVVVQAVMGGLFLARDTVLHDAIKKKLTSKIRDEYDPDGKDVFAFSINILNYLMDCCGINNAEDFLGFKPVMSCCRKFLMADASELATCKHSNYNYGNFYFQGCYTVLQNKVRESSTLAALILSFLLVLQVTEIVYAIDIVKDVGKVGPV